MARTKPRSKTTTDPAQIAEIEAMSLKQFKQERVLVHVDSEVFGEVVVFAPNKAVASRAPKGMVVYTAAELAIVSRYDYDREGLEIIHELKKKLDGTLLDPVKGEHMRKSDEEAEIEIEVKPENLDAAVQLGRMVQGPSRD